ncbi:predicted protein [Chaetoceros tenuissimus]|uniref:Uncharacterized protein n=1 Tax=Chaetoceros tenuissimus TaxID=426638 RepID=A0AAD3D683_9STRA|nr:predicted protein [Chaetoceros tenuissimus]
MCDHSPPESLFSPLASRSMQMGRDAGTPLVPSSPFKNYTVVSSKATEENREEFEAELTEDINNNLADTSVVPSAAIDDSSVHNLQETMPSTDTTTMRKEELEAKLAEATDDICELINCGMQILSKKEGIELKLLEAIATIQALGEQLQDTKQALADKDAELVNVKKNTKQALANKDAELDKLGSFYEGEKVHVYWLEHSKVTTGLAELWNGEILKVGPNDNYVIRFRRNPRDSEYWDEVWHETAIRRGWNE